MMFRGTLRLVATTAVLAIPLVGCNSATDPIAVAQKVSIQISSGTALVRPTGYDGFMLSVPVKITNTTGAQVFLNCSPSIERLVDSNWVVLTKSLCFPASQRLMPGETTTTYASAFDVPRAEERVDLSIVGGTYRVRVGMYVGAAFPGRGPIESQTVQFVASNEFTTVASCISFPVREPLGCT